MGSCIVAGGKPDMAAPVGGILLSSIAEGSIVKLNENGSPVEFYVAKHDYESALNGTGRTLMVRKDCYDKRAWDSSEVNNYPSSDIAAWLVGTYKKILDSDVQIAIGTTSIYYTPGNGNSNVGVMTCPVFLLSLTELGAYYANVNTEGSALPIGRTLQGACLNGTSVTQWTRSPITNSTVRAAIVSSVDMFGHGVVSSDSVASRPCFTLPSTSVFDKNTMLLLGVA